MRGAEAPRAAEAEAEAEAGAAAVPAAEVPDEVIIIDEGPPAFRTATVRPCRDSPYGREREEAE